jgi:hypothetical protein
MAGAVDAALWGRDAREHRPPLEVGRDDGETTLLAIAALMAVALLPGSASASTCSDYSNQAQAQRAHDTRDSDGDGIYCVISPR